MKIKELETIYYNSINDTFNDFKRLAKRGFLTPNNLSGLLSMIIVPIKFIGSDELHKFNQNSNNYHCNVDNYSITRNLDHKLETVLLQRKNSMSNNCQIFFGGNVQDGLNYYFINYLIQKYGYDNNTLLFCNYPGVRNSSFYSRCSSEDDLSDAGVRMVLKLINEHNIAATNITLNGHSLGGAVAIATALKLQKSGHRVNLCLSNTFDKVYEVIPQKIYSDPYSNVPKYKKMLPIIEALLCGPLAGLSLGTTVSGLIATGGLMIDSVISSLSFAWVKLWSGIGFCLEKFLTGFGAIASCLYSEPQQREKIIGSYAAAAKTIKQCCQYIGLSIGSGLVFLGKFARGFIDIVGSVIGGIVALAGAIVGVICGAITGALFFFRK